MTEFRFKQFGIKQEQSAMKVGTDGVLLGAWAPVDGVRRALDVGAGTGLIALMLAQRGAEHVSAVEIDPDACAEASGNVERSPWVDKVCVKCVDFREFKAEKPYDLIVSNPPYNEESLESPDPRRAAARSQSALPLEALITHAAEMLAPMGKLALILPHSQLDRLIYAAAMNRLNVNTVVEVAHHRGRSPRRIMALLSRELTPIVKQSLYIQSAEFANLTKEFYL